MILNYILFLNLIALINAVHVVYVKDSYGINSDEEVPLYPLKYNKKPVYYPPAPYKKTPNYGNNYVNSYYYDNKEYYVKAPYKKPKTNYNNYKENNYNENKNNYKENSYKENDYKEKNYKKNNYNENKYKENDYKENSYKENNYKENNYKDKDYNKENNYGGYEETGGKSYKQNYDKQQSNYNYENKEQYQPEYNNYEKDDYNYKKSNEEYNEKEENYYEINSYENYNNYEPSYGGNNEYNNYQQIPNYYIPKYNFPSYYNYMTNYRQPNIYYIKPIYYATTTTTKATEKPSTTLITTIATSTDSLSTSTNSSITSTEVPTTEITTEVPTTEIPTTEITTEVPTTEITTEVPTTEIPTTEITTELPTTEIPSTTIELTTEVPSTSTEIPSTTLPSETTFFSTNEAITQTTETSPPLTTEITTEVPTTEIITTEITSETSITSISTDETSTDGTETTASPTSLETESPPTGETGAPSGGTVTPLTTVDNPGFTDSTTINSTITTTDSPGPCDPEWDYYEEGDYCMKISSLKDKELTWKEAEEEAKKNGAKLISVHDKKEDEFIKDHVAKEEGIEDKVYWIGLQINGTDGKIQKATWSDQTDLTYGNPNNIGQNNQPYGSKNTFTGDNAFVGISKDSSTNGNITWGIYDPKQKGGYIMKLESSRRVTTVGPGEKNDTIIDNHGLPDGYSCVKGCDPKDIKLNSQNGFDAPIDEGPQGTPNCQTSVLTCKSNQPTATITFGEKGSVKAKENENLKVRAKIYCVREESTKKVGWLRNVANNNPKLFFFVDEAHCEQQ